MSLFGVILLILSVATCIAACVEYARSSWHANDDLMGASFTFTAIWMLATALLVAGLGVLSLLHLWSGLAVAVGCVIVGKLVEWFMIEPVLYQLFPAYRRDVS